jgi:hypothetical protein
MLAMENAHLVQAEYDFYATKDGKRKNTRRLAPQ